MSAPVFTMDVRQWKTTDELRHHLAGHDKKICEWVRGAVLHHTYRPVQSQWRGIRSVKAIARFYQLKGWTAGPHLFICVGAPNPADDGIFQMTPLNLRGIHAAQFNKTHWGIEVVGDYDTQPWPTTLRDVVEQTVTELFRWRGVTPTNFTLLGHRDTGSLKTCPGRMVNIADVRSAVARRLA